MLIIFACCCLLQCTVKAFELSWCQHELYHLGFDADDTESLLLQTPAIPSISRGDTTTAAQTEPPPASARRLSDSEQEQDLSAPLQLQIYLPDGEAVR